MDGLLVGTNNTLDRALHPYSTPDHPGLMAKLATDTASRASAYALRHQSYLAYGHIDPLPEKSFSDHFDEISSSKTLVIYKNGLPVASVRISLYAPESSILGSDEVPATEIFKNEVDSFLYGLGRSGKAARAVDISRLVRHPDHRDDNNLIYALFRMAGYVILNFGVDVIFATVRANHIPFYRRMGFRPVAEPRDYPRTKFKTGLMAWINSDVNGTGRTLPILDSVSIDDSAYQTFMDGEFVPVLSGAAALRMNRERRKPALGAAKSVSDQDHLDRGALCVSKQVLVTSTRGSLST